MSESWQQFLLITGTEAISAVKIPLPLPQSSFWRPLAHQEACAQSLGTRLPQPWLSHPLSQLVPSILML